MYNDSMIFDCNFTIRSTLMFLLIRDTLISTFRDTLLMLYVIGINDNHYLALQVLRQYCSFYVRNLLFSVIEMGLFLFFKAR